MPHTDMLRKAECTVAIHVTNHVFFVCSIVIWRSTMVATNNGPAPSALFSTQWSQTLQSYMLSCDQCLTRPLSQLLGQDRSTCTSHVIFTIWLFEWCRNSLGTHCIVQFCRFNKSSSPCDD